MNTNKYTNLTKVYNSNSNEHQNGNHRNYYTLKKFRVTSTKTSHRHQSSLEKISNLPKTLPGICRLQFPLKVINVNF